MIISSQYRRLSFLFFWLWLVMIIYLMIRPTDGLPKIDIPGFDKFVHFVLFSTLGFLYYAQQIPRKAVIKRYKKNPGFYLLILFSLGIEFLHLFIDYRSFELLDIATNGLSLFFGIFGIKAIIEGIRFKVK